MQGFLQIPVGHVVGDVAALVAVGLFVATLATWMEIIGAAAL